MDPESPPSVIGYRSGEGRGAYSDEMGEMFRYVYVGGGEFAVDLLDALLERGIPPATVITHPDRPRGRGLRTLPNPVAEKALRHGLPVRKPRDARDPEFQTILKEAMPDLVLVADYGRIIPGELLSLYPGRFLNLHPSLLPSFRGADPIRRALMEGVEKTGVTLMVVEERLDGGPVLAREVVEVGLEEDAESLRRRLASSGAGLFADLARPYLEGRLRAVPQEEGSATYAPPVSREETAIDWNRDAASIHNQVRALYPRPGAHTRWRGRRLKLLRTRPASWREELGPGVVAVDEGKRLMVGTGDGILDILLIQPEGRRALEAQEFLRGYDISGGERLGE